MEQAANQASGSGNSLVPGVTSQTKTRKKDLVDPHFDYLANYGHFSDPCRNFFSLPVSATRRTPIARTAI